MEWSRDRRASRGGSRAGRRAGSRARGETEGEPVLAWTGLGGFIHRFAMGSSCNVWRGGKLLPMLPCGKYGQTVWPRAIGGRESAN